MNGRVAKVLAMLNALSDEDRLTVLDACAPPREPEHERPGVDYDNMIVQMPPVEQEPDGPGASPLLVPPRPGQSLV